jgi:hypothetical protein
MCLIKDLLVSRALENLENLQSHYRHVPDALAHCPYDVRDFIIAVCLMRQNFGKKA